MDLKDEIREQRNLRFSESSIVPNMVRKGYSLTDVQAAFKEVQEEEYQEIKRRNPLLYNKFLPVIVLAILYWFYFHFLSVYTINQYTTLLAITGGILFAIFIPMSIYRLFPSVEKGLPYLLPLLGIATVFVFGFIFIKFAMGAESRELKQYGILTNASILDGRAITGSKHNEASLKIYFVTEAKQEITTKIDVGVWEFDKHYSGEIIPVVYSKRDPYVVKIADNPAPWKKHGNN